MDFHHRRAHAHPGNLRFKITFIFAVIVRNIGGRPTHVEPDDLLETIHFGRADHADNTARRARQNGVLALKLRGIRQPAIRLHEHQFHTAKLACDLINIAAQDRRQIRINNRGIAARHQLHQRADLMADRYLSKPDIACNLGRRIFMRGITVPMHEHDGTGTNAVIVNSLQLGAQRVTIKCGKFFALRVKAAIGLNHAFIEHFRQFNVAIEQTRAVLISQTQ